MEVITLANQKGGVAKTTTASALASGLYQRNNKVLIIDLDPQSNFTLGCGIDVLSLAFTIYDVFSSKEDINNVITKTPLGYDLVAGGLNLAAADMEFTQLGREKMLSKAISKIRTKYDYILIDTPPTLGILTANALIASTTLIVPMSADIYSIQGLSQLNGFLENVYENGNPNLRLAGLLITKYNARQNLTKVLLEQIKNTAKQLNTKVFNTKIRESVAVRETALLQDDLFKEAPKANATIDYNNFIDELLGGMKHDQ